MIKLLDGDQEDMIFDFLSMDFYRLFVNDLETGKKLGEYSLRIVYCTSCTSKYMFPNW